MATKKRKKKAASAAAPKRRRKSSSRRKGLAGLPATGGTTTQKLLSGALLVGSGLLGGAAGAAVGNKFNLPAGVALTLASMAFMPEKYKVAGAVAGVGMALAPGRLAVGTVPAATNGVSGIEGFASDAISRVKNFAGELAEKAYVPAPMKKMLGIAGYADNVDYNPYTANDDYARMLRNSYAGGDGGSLMAGTQPFANPLLAGLANNQKSINY